MCKLCPHSVRFFNLPPLALFVEAVVTDSVTLVSIFDLVILTTNFTATVVPEQCVRNGYCVEVVVRVEKGHFFEADLLVLIHRVESRLSVKNVQLKPPLFEKYLPKFSQFFETARTRFTLAAFLISSANSCWSLQRDFLIFLKFGYSSTCYSDGNCPRTAQVVFWITGAGLDFNNRLAAFQKIAVSVNFSEDVVGNWARPLPNLG